MGFEESLPALTKGETLFTLSAGSSSHLHLDRSARLSRKGMWRNRRISGRGFRLKERRFRLVPTSHPHRAQMPSRSRSLFARNVRLYLQGALSTKASLLPLGAFGLVPPLHDDRPQISVPMTTISECTLTIGNTGWGV